MQQCHISIFCRRGDGSKAVINIPDANVWNKPYGYDGQDPIGPLTDEQALDILQHCDAFKIRGMNGAGGASVSTSFLLDDLRWLDRNAIPIDPNADSLRKYAVNHHLYVGSWTRSDQVYNVC